MWSEVVVGFCVSCTLVCHLSVCGLRTVGRFKTLSG